MAPNSPSASPLIPSEKYRTSGLPLLTPSTPKARAQRPPAPCPPVLIGIVPCNFPLLGIKALISLWRKLKLPTSTSLLNRRKLRSEEHTSELQSLRHLVCRLLLE